MGEQSLNLLGFVSEHSQNQALPEIITETHLATNSAQNIPFIMYTLTQPTT